MWPDTPLTTYIAGSLPKAKASDINAIQKAIGDLFGAIFGVSRWGVFEEFNYRQVNSTTTLVLSNGFTAFATSGNPRFKIDDASTPADGTFGRLLVETADGNAVVTHCETGRMGVGTRDFYFAARVLVPARARLDTFTNVGLRVGVNTSAGSDDGPAFIAGSGNNAFSNGNWVAKLGGVQHDAGISITDNTYYWLEILRTGGATTFYIDHVAKFSGADVTSYSTETYPDVALASLGSLAANTDLLSIDKVGLIVFTRP